MDFQNFQKIPRLSREVVITEKIDGINAQVFIETYGVRLNEPHVFNWPYSYAKEVNGGTTFIFAESRKTWITPGIHDNMGFANWVRENGEELLKLGEGRHFGEWWGRKIHRGYNLKEKRFSLFNVSKWTSEFNEFRQNGGIVREYSTVCLEIPVCHVVPLIYIRPFETEFIQGAIDELASHGSYASPGFMNPEGIVIYHTAGGYYFKKTIKNDESPKSLIKE